MSVALVACCRDWCSGRSGARPPHMAAQEEREQKKGFEQTAARATKATRKVP